jgi:uncharacterized protein YjbI with pentapeptide repeats
MASPKSSCIHGQLPEQESSRHRAVEKDLTAWDFAGQDLTNANLDESTLTNANLSGAVVTRTSFAHTAGFTKEQLYSTASYQSRNLQGIWLWNNDLTAWDFSGQDLTNAVLQDSTLANANLSGANFTNAILSLEPYQRQPVGGQPH